MGLFKLGVLIDKNNSSKNLTKTTLNALVKINTKDHSIINRLFNEKYNFFTFINTSSGSFKK
jgi:hypothetical protein